MTFDHELDELLEDSITIEPWVSQDADLKPTFGAAVTYSPVLVELKEDRVIDGEGREFRSSVRVLIPEVVTIDKRSRVTLPASFVPRQPPIHSVVSHRGVGLDHTIVIFGAGGEFSAQ